MTDIKKMAPALIAVSCALGIWADTLFREAHGIGLNAVGWVVALLTAGLWLAKRGGLTPSGDGKWFAIPAVTFSVCLAWRDSGMLHVLDCWIVQVTLALCATFYLVGSAHLSGLGRYIKALAFALGHALTGAAHLLGKETDWTGLQSRPWSNTGVAIIKGLMVAVPLLVIFGGLFISADPIFKHFISTWFDWDTASLVQHVIWIFVGFWGCAGLLRYALTRQPDPAVGDVPKAETGGIFGPVEIGTILGLMDVLFLSFVIVQVRYLFGGAALVHSMVHMTFAEYARQGFFELATASGLLLPVLLLLHWCCNRHNPAAMALFRWLSTVQIGLLFVIMASAMVRMRLYQDIFGLTELRIYTVAFMGWLALVFVWMMVTVLPGREERFTFGALTAGLAVVFALHCVNPDALIVRTNVRRAIANHRFDACYAISLSNDAAADLAGDIDRLTPQDQATVAKRLLESAPPASIDWRRWNLGTATAWNAVQSRLPVLRDLAKNAQPNTCSQEID